MSFRKYGGTQFASSHNIVKSNVNTTGSFYVTENVGQPNTYINFESDISGNIIIYGDLDVSGNLIVSGDADINGKLHVQENIDCSGNVNVDGDVTASKMFLTAPNHTYLDNEVVPKSYVNSVAVGLKPLAPCNLCSNAGAISLSGPQTIDGIPTTNGMRVLVNAQGYVSPISNPANFNNGIYVVDTSGPWTRATDLVIGDEATGTAMLILQGTTYADYRFVCALGSNTSPVFIGTNPVTNAVLWTVFDTPFKLGQGLNKSNVNNNTFINVDSSLNFIQYLDNNDGPTPGIMNIGTTTTTTPPLTPMTNINIGNAGVTVAVTGATTILGTTNINNTGSSSTSIGNGTGTTSIGNVTGTTTITGTTVAVNGTTNINNTGTSSTNIGNVTGTTTITGATNINGYVDITSGGLEVSGGLTSNDATTCTGILTANGGITATAGIGTTTLTASGFVGIGTTNPQYPLQLQGTSGTLLKLQNNTPVYSYGSTDIEFWTSTGSCPLGSISAQDLSYMPPSGLGGPFTSQMLFNVNWNSTSIGALVNGMTLNGTGDESPASTNPVGPAVYTGGANLTINGATYYSGLTSNPMPAGLTVATTTGSIRLLLGAYYTSDTTYAPAGGEACAIQSSDFYNNQDNFANLLLNPQGGSVGINNIDPQFPLDVTGIVNATSYNSASDYRIKKDVIPLDEKFTVDKLRPVTYNNTKLDKQDIGLIAHELQEIYPFLVNGEKDGEHFQSVNYTGLIGILIKEIQELKERVKKLENPSS